MSKQDNKQEIWPSEVMSRLLWNPIPLDMVDLLLSFYTYLSSPNVFTQSPLNDSIEIRVVLWTPIFSLPAPYAAAGYFLHCIMHLTMEGTVLTLSVLAIIFSISSLGVILLCYCCCREHEWTKYIDDGGFAVKYQNTNSRGSIALKESNKDGCQLDNLSNHHYKETLHQEFPLKTITLMILQRTNKIHGQDIW